MGVYCINATRYLFRAEPFAFEATSDHERFKQVEESVTATLRFAEDRVATFTCSFRAADVSEYEMVGTKGSLRADPAYEFATDLKMKLTMDSKTRESDQFAPQLIYFSDCILNNRDPEPSGREGMADVQVVIAIYESLKTGR
jgi:predicted dehydrogenase